MLIQAAALALLSVTPGVSAQLPDSIPKLGITPALANFGAQHFAVTGTQRVHNTDSSLAKRQGSSTCLTGYHICPGDVTQTCIASDNRCCDDGSFCKNNYYCYKDWCCASALGCNAPIGGATTDTIYVSGPAAASSAAPTVGGTSTDPDDEVAIAPVNGACTVASHTQLCRAMCLPPQADCCPGTGWCPTGYACHSDGETCCKLGGPSCLADGITSGAVGPTTQGGGLVNGVPSPTASAPGGQGGLGGLGGNVGTTSQPGVITGQQSFIPGGGVPTSSAAKGIAIPDTTTTASAAPAIPPSAANPLTAPVQWVVGALGALVAALV